MSGMNVYLDNAATTRVCEEAIDAMLRVMREDYGNPSSTHSPGRYAAAVLSGARSKVAGALGARPDDVCFTSGGTESDNWAILGAAETMSRKGKHIVTSAIEHDAVLSPVNKLENSGWDVTYIKPDSSGRISAEAFAEALRDDTVIASIMLVNNETGAVNPVGDYSREIKRRRLSTVLHTDAVQGFCKIPFTADTLGADLITVTAHKIHGPKGVGALYARRGLRLPPLMLGGGQESGRRSGTEPIPAIAGFGEAAWLAYNRREKDAEHARALRDYIIGLIRDELPEAVMIGEGDSPYILSLSLPGYMSETVMNRLDSVGVYIAKSAACKKGARSRVLEAMGLSDDVINGVLRVSLSRYNTIEEAGYFAEMLANASKTLINNAKSTVRRKR